MNKKTNDVPADAVNSQFTGRYSRQVRFPPFGPAGQDRLLEATVVIVGCGALGSLQASIMVRAGVGKIRLIDRDFLELSNLQRQFIYDEQDVASGLPKAIVARQKLESINAEVIVESFVEDLNDRNVAAICKNATLILDGTDNFETRFLINDYSVHSRTPWIYGGCIGCDGQSMTVIPGETSCLHCLMTDGPPAAGTTETCDSAGILAPIISLIASFQCAEAMKIISGNLASINRGLLSVALWENQFRMLDLTTLNDVECPVCDRQQFKWLDGTNTSKSAVLCGRNAVQISKLESGSVDMQDIERTLSTIGTVRRNPFMLQAEINEFFVTIFPDGRAIIKGTEDVAKAKSLYSQWIGN